MRTLRGLIGMIYKRGDSNCPRGDSRSVIEARRLEKSFGEKSVLRGVDLRVADGEIVAVLGPNGAGKTTLLRILSTLSSPSSGEVLIDGVRVEDDPPKARRRIGMVGHSTCTYDDLTALENLRFQWVMEGLPRKEFAKAGMEILRRVGLEHRMNDRVGIFSKGMRQRLALARALIHTPKVLLLDEPFSSLDQKGVAVLEQMLNEERSRGASILVVTHDVHRIASLIDRAVVLENGRLAKSLSREELSKWTRESPNPGGTT